MTTISRISCRPLPKPPICLRCLARPLPLYSQNSPARQYLNTPSMTSMLSLSPQRPPHSLPNLLQSLYTSTLDHHRANHTPYIRKRDHQRLRRPSKPLHGGYREPLITRGLSASWRQSPHGDDGWNLPRRFQKLYRLQELLPTPSILTFSPRNRRWKRNRLMQQLVFHLLFFLLGHIPLRNPFLHPTATSFSPSRQYGHSLSLQSHHQVLLVLLRWQKLGDCRHRTFLSSRDYNLYSVI
jgi:hypothetical protein